MTCKKATFLFCIFLMLLTFSLSLLPGHNGDLPFYIAATFSRQGLTDEEALSKTKTVMQQEMPAEEAARHGERIDHAEKNILDFYQIKPAYIYSILLLHGLGIPFIISTLIPSLLSFFLIGCLVFSWSSRVFSPLQALVFSGILMLMGPSVTLARLSTPDALSNLFIFFCFYRIFFGKGNGITVLVLLLCLLIRLDNLVAVLLLLTLIRSLPVGNSAAKPGWGMYLLSVLLALSLSLWVNDYFEKDFWWFNRITYIRSAHAYGIQVLIYLLTFCQSFFVPLLLLIFLAVFQGKLVKGSRPARILTSIGAVVFVRFLLFPSLEERFETAYLITGFLLLLQVLFGGPVGNPGSAWSNPALRQTKSA